MTTFTHDGAHAMRQNIKLSRCTWFCYTYWETQCPHGGPHSPPWGPPWGATVIWGPPRGAVGVTTALIAPDEPWGRLGLKKDTVSVPAS